MGDIDNTVSLSIQAGSVSVPRAGFGTGLILSYTATWAERVRTYKKFSDVSADFAVTTSPEYLSAQAYFSQSPRPKQLKIGRCALPPTQVYVLTPTAANTTDYVLVVSGEAVTTTTITVTSDASATVAEICGLLETAINGVTGFSAVATAVDGTTEVTITADATGNWFSLAPKNPTLLKVEQTHVDPGVATDLAAIQVEDPDWYGLLTNYNSSAMVLAADAWIQTNKKIYQFDVNESEAVTTAVTNGDTGDAIKTLVRARTQASYHWNPAEFFSAAWMGRLFALDVNADPAYKILTGITVQALTSSQRVNLLARNMSFVETVATKNVPFDGKTGDGDYLNVQRGLDWLDDDMKKEVFENLIAPDVFPFTDAGGQSLGSAMQASLDRGVRNGVLAADPAPTVFVPLVADILAADKDARTFTGLEFTATKLGAVHKANIVGTVL